VRASATRTTRGARERASEDELDAGRARGGSDRVTSSSVGPRPP
jgi:hypothetical protein